MLLWKENWRDHMNKVVRDANEAVRDNPRWCCWSGRLQSWPSSAEKASKKMISSYVSENKLFGQLLLYSELEVKLMQAHWQRSILW